MENYILEFLGTMVLIFLGEGVNCATSLNKTKAQGAGWVVAPLIGSVCAVMLFLAIY